MRAKRRQELDDLIMEVWRMKRKLTEILKEEREYADSPDELDDDEYFHRRFVEQTVELLKAAIEHADGLSDKMDEAREEWNGGNENDTGNA